MTKKYEILGKYIKDLSSETRDVQTYLFVKEYIGKYQLNIDINSKALKNKLIEISTTLKFEDKEPNELKSYFEITFATIIRPANEIKEKKDLEKIILCDVQIEIYPDLETKIHQIHTNYYIMTPLLKLSFSRHVESQIRMTG